MIDPRFFRSILAHVYTTPVFFFLARPSACPSFSAVIGPKRVPVGTSRAGPSR